MEMKRKTFYLSFDSIKWIEKMAKKESRSLSNYLDNLIQKIIKEQK
jgi:hypothetical protein